MRRCVIVGGADISDYANVKKHLNNEDYYVFCDSGLKHLEKLSVRADLIVGDFDSHENPCLDTETIVLPCEKDDTDTMYALKEGIRRGFKNFLLVGVVGQRFDHTMGNISALMYLDSRGMTGEIVDDFSLMSVVSAQPVYVCDDYPYFSLLNISGVAKGVTIENAKYPLCDAEIDCEYQYGISNEVLKGKKAKISVQEGRLLLVKIRKS